ncbi:cytochrome B [Aureispira anguillae]|uniref:Cytochrome B n=1 Tax=Aureispira anguillae TaxID=2864201 RepID=A0A916DVI8_9BACT|nr:cytochrome B [Aureispira anguillae]BDS13615.1 cytochrome B [Aureispira anguillae]
MLEGIKHAHSGLRWIVLILLLLAIVNAFSGWRSKKPYTAQNKKLHLFAMIFVHIQVLIGFISYLLNWGGKVNFGNMSNSMIRFFTVEHSTMMLLALIAITIGFSKSKKITETPSRFKMIFMAYLIGLLLILAGIPWPFRTALGAGWF